MKKTLFLSAILGAALCSSAYGARTLADYSTTDGEMTFSGAIIEYTGTSNNQAIGTSGVTFDINKSGTTYQKKGASQNPEFGGTNGNLWEYLTTHKDNVVYGHTIKMSGSTGGAVKLSTAGMGQTIFGGLITTSANNNASYTLDASSGDVILKGNDSGANMNIGSNTTLTTSTSNTVEVQGDGTWNIQEGKSLTLAGGRFWINGANTVTLSGGGTLKFNIGNLSKLQLDANSGFNITGGTTVEMNDGLKCEFGTGAGFTSTDGTGKVNYAVTATQTAGATNGFGTLTYAAPGNLSIGSGVTLLLNGVEADFTDGTLSTASTIYHIVENTAFNKASKASYTGATGFQIENGATLRITEKTSDSNGIIYGAVTVKNGGVLHLEANDALGWSGNNVKSLLVENGAEVKLTHSSNETWGGTLTLQGNAKISGDNARWDMYTNSSATVAANANATFDIKELRLRRNDTTFTLKNHATLTINSDITNAVASNEGNGNLLLTSDDTTGVTNLNGSADLKTLAITGGTANINHDMTVVQIMLSKTAGRVTTVNVAENVTLNVTGNVTSVPQGGSGGSFELCNWSSDNVLNIRGTLISNAGISMEGNGAPTVNIANGGTLTMNAGLIAAKREGDLKKAAVINVESGATLNVAGTADITDTTLITVNVKDGAILGGAYGSGATAIINKNFALEENAAVTLQTAAEKQLTFNGTFGTETTTLIVQGGGQATLGEATSALASVTIKENTGLTLAGDTAINGLTIGTGASIVTNGTLTLTGTASYTGTTQTRSEGRTADNGFGSTITYADAISGEGAVSSTATWTLNGTAATLNGKELSYGTANNVYYINTSDSITNITADHIGNANGAITSDVELVGNASTVGMKLTGTQTGATYTFSGAFTGTGNLVIEPTTAAGNQLADTYVFSGDNTHTGAIVATSNTEVVFNGDSTSISSALKAPNGHITAYYEHGTSVTVTGDIDNNPWKKQGVIDLNVTDNTTVAFNGAVTADVLTVEGGSSVSFGQNATLSAIAGEGSLSLSHDLTVTGNTATIGSLTLSNGADITVNDHNGTLNITGLTVKNNDSAINANLVVAGGTISFADNTTLTMGCSVTIGADGLVTVELTDEMVSTIAGGGRVDLFTDVEGAQLVNGKIVFTGVDGATLDKANVYSLQYDETTHTIYATPEPATATLSLLALAGLCARRKRH